jgi:K+-sensing histidine kinase KdpD
LVKRSTYLVNEQKRKNIYRQYHLSSKIVAAISHDIQTPLQYVSAV